MATTSTSSFPTVAPAISLPKTKSSPTVAPTAVVPKTHSYNLIFTSQKVFFTAFNSYKYALLINGNFLGSLTN